MSRISQVVHILVSWLDVVNLEVAESRVQHIADDHYAKGAPLDFSRIPPDIDPTTSFHEAAHAAVGYSLGRAVRRVYVIGTNDGACEFVGACSAISRVISLLAGPAAELLLLQEVSVVREVTLAHSFDLFSARLAVGEARIANSTAAMLAVSIVSAQWHAIQRIAGALRVASELTGEEVASLLAVN